jgi:hypothetical protein
MVLLAWKWFDRQFGPPDSPGAAVGGRLSYDSPAANEGSLDDVLPGNRLPGDFGPATVQKVGPSGLSGILEASRRSKSMLSRQTLSVLAAVSFAAACARAEEPRPIAADQFDRLHKMIRVQPDEQRFWQIAWKLSITEAREQAAKEGKPIFVWAGAGGAPIGVC